jgi:protein SCO1/2
MLGAAPFAGVLLAQASDDPHAGHQQEGEKREWSNESPRETLKRHFFPNVALRTHENKEVRFYDDLIQDKIVMINMMYTNCRDLCPLLTANLARVHKLLGQHGKQVGRDIHMYSISLDPEYDKPQVLKQYMKAQKVGPGWTFLTGTPKDIEFLRRSLGYEDPLPFRDKNKENHAGMVRYGNEPLTRWAMLQGMAKPKLIVELITKSVFA